MGRTPYETALRWEKDLADSDCLILDDLRVVEERDPVWYQSLCDYHIRNIILYAIRYNQVLVGFIWAANYDAEKRMRIKETLELSTFLISAVISNYQLVTRLELRSTVDILTGVSNRNAMNDRITELCADPAKIPGSLGVIFADMNGLKYTNDHFGHNAGDRLLKDAAVILQSTFVGAEIYRAGGDEFLVLLPGTTEADMRKKIADIKKKAAMFDNVSFAAGGCFLQPGMDLRDAMSEADAQMYRDKGNFYRKYPELRRD